METAPARLSRLIRFVDTARALQAPPWLKDLFGVATGDQAGDVCTCVAAEQNATLITVRIPDAIALEPDAFQRATIYAYSTIRRNLGAHRPVRFWNHIPGIHAVMDSERDRYMVFNAGRFRAFESWYGSASAFSQHVATASGVGHGGRDLVIHCLATAAPGTAIENPRQIASYKYSRRYGPLPPCFARATAVGGLVLVGGTASIRGEDSIHLDSLSLQIDETFENLARLVTAARRDGSQDGSPLSRCRYLRIYYRRERDVSPILDAVEAAFGSLVDAEMIQAELCRSELLVEIEGVAQL